MQIDAADRRTPSAIRTELGRYAGLNRFGGANWRIIVAQDHLVTRGGIFKTMPSGDVKSFEVDPKTFQMHYRDIKPERVETGLRQVPKYPCKGWILERWFAPETVNRTVWEAAMSSDGVTPMMGPYPERGYYFMLAGPWEQMPEMWDLKMAISMHIRMEEEQPTSYKQMLLNEVNEKLAEEQAEYDKVVSDLAHFYDSEVDPVMKRLSLGAGRIRNELAAARGDFSQQGVA